MAIHDANIHNYVETLFEAVKVLRKLNLEGHTIFIYDTSGVSRVPTLFLAYLLLVGFFDDKDFDSKKRENLPWFDKSKKMEIWDYLEESAMKLLQRYPNSRPNQKAAMMIVENNLDYL